MSYKKLINQIELMSENFTFPSLSVLLREAEGEEEAVEDSEESDIEASEEDENVAEESADSDENVEITDRVEDLADNIKYLEKKLANILPSTKEKSVVFDFLLSKVHESYYLKNQNISKLLFESDDLKDLEVSIDAIERVLDKGTDLIDTWIKGSDIPVEKYVESAIEAYKHFDSLFSKEIIIKQEMEKLIRLNSGSKAEDNIKEFDNLYFNELSNQFGIEYKDHVIQDKDGYHSAAGATKSGSV